MTALAYATLAPSAPSAPAVTTSELRALGEALAAPRAQIESKFLAVGAGLAEGSAILNRVTRVFEALPAQLQSPEMEAASTRLADVGHQAKAIAALFSREQADLARLNAVVASAEYPIVELRRAVQMMSIVAINARTVAASVAVSGDDFEVFTTDIAKLSASATSTIQAFTVAYGQLTSEVRKAAQQTGQSQYAHADTLNELAGNMEAALEELAQQRAVSVGATAETGRISRQIAGRIGSAVMALQVGDATRQRIEHAEGGIATLCDLIDKGSLSDDEVAVACAALGGLQARQLAGAATALENDVADAGSALRDLAADASAIVAKSQATFGQSKAGGTSLAMLSLTVGHAAEVLRDCETERSKLEKLATAVLGTVGVLLGHVAAVQEIEDNMRLVSLNATIKCAQLGPRGAALNVIARQLRELTSETVTAAEAAMKDLHEAASLARSFGEAASGDTTSRVGQLETQARESLALLHGVDRSFADALSTLDQDVPKVRRLLDEAAKTLTSQDQLLASIRHIEAQLRHRCSDTITGDPTGVITEAVAAHSRCYSMDEERRIHEQMFGSGPSTALPEPAPATSDADIFF